jgi:uncharacterized protein (DUF3084 family)
VTNIGDKLKGFYAAMTPVKWVALAVGIVVLIVLFVVGKDEVSQWWHNHQQAKYEKQINSLEENNKKLASENDQLRGERNQSMANAQQAEIERDAMKVELEKYGKAAQGAVKAQEKAAEIYEQDKQNINTDVSNFDRCKSLCGTRAELGYKCAPNFCDRYR